ncbi:MAG TPA: EamA family transporter RarD [Sulfitobacter sp.]|jgi:chloramphenicol-sensitive protein RarD|uniref:EamA family transporter RarD n=1 Tax=Sulfitobacter dubius TaxID=218673 RepID=UPI000C4B7237|nr:protein RarD [Sulfitobacter sp.]HBB83532.1 EamA family transporter RarD [Sulfitobacter sp.]
MTDTTKGFAAMIAACCVWGLSSIFYKLLAHVPAAEVLAHRTLWSLVFFVVVLTVQGRLRSIFSAMAGPRAFGLLAIATIMIATNWYIFIWSVQNGQATEAALGYYIFPLVSVLLGRLVFAEQLNRVQLSAVGLVTVAVALLTFGLGSAPWLAVMIAASFGLYGLAKKRLAVGPVVSVTAEVLLLSPLAILVLWQTGDNGAGAFGASFRDTALLMLAGPITATPLILFSYAARRLSMATAGLLSYINPTLQFFCAVVLFREPFTGWHVQAFVLIWCALALYSVTTFRKEKARRRALRAASASATTVT